MQKKNIDSVYVVASKLGSIGMGTTAYYANKKINNSREINSLLFCRGFDPKLKLNSKKIYSYGYLEYLSLPLRFLEKKMGLNINPFKIINTLFAKKIEKNMPPSKIYHTWMRVAPQAIKKAKKQGSILILEGANSHPVYAWEIFDKEYKKLHKEAFLEEKSSVKKESEIIKLFDYVMCPSDFVYDSFLKNGFKKNQLIKVPYGVDLDLFQYKEKTDKKFRAVFIGSIQIRKGLHYLLEAWDALQLKNAELIIVGRVWPDSLDLVKPFEKNKSIKFVGFDKNPSKYLHNASVFISPSLEEGSALTCYEAMACGVPLIATYNTGSVARNNKDGFIIPAANKKILKQKIHYLYNHQKKCKQMGKSARKQVEKYSWEHYSKNVYKIYKEILHEKK